MERRGTHDREDSPSEPPRWYRIEEVTVIAEPRAPRLRAWVSNMRSVPMRRGKIAAAVASIVIAGTIAVITLHGPNAGASVPQARALGAAGVAAAYRYPVSCLVVTLAASDRAYARARLNRASPCWRYGVYDTTIFHRVDGAWRLVLNVHTYSCPVPSVPAVVQAQLAVCPRPGAAHTR
jgi:hypothetical protein